MNCPICQREGMNDKEMKVHIKYFHKEDPNDYIAPQQKMTAGICPDCNSTMWFEEGCATCHSCGFSKCA